MLANVMLAGEVCQKLSGPADGNICSVFLILLIESHAGSIVIRSDNLLASDICRHSPQ